MSTRWVWSLLSTYTKNWKKILSWALNWTRGRWVRSANATPVLCAPPFWQTYYLTHASKSLFWSKLDLAMPLIWTIYCFQGFTTTLVAFMSSSILIFQVPQWRRSSCLSAVPGLPGQATDLLQQHSQPNGRIQSGNFNLKSSTIAQKLH